MNRYKHLTMVFTYIQYLNTWECELTSDKEHRIKFYGYAEGAKDAMNEAVREYENAPRAVQDRL